MSAIVQKAMSSAGQNVQVVQIDPSLQYATLSIYCLNKDTVEANVDISVGTSAAPSATDYIEVGAKIPPNGGILERECIIMAPGERLVVKSSNSMTIVRVSGLGQT